MQKIQILFPDPQMEALRSLARIEDRPVSEIGRLPVERDIDVRSGLLHRTESAASGLPAFDGGKVLPSAFRMKSVLYDDQQR